MGGLQAICDREGVDVTYQDLDPDRGLLGMYIKEGSRSGIILDRSLISKPRLERCVMAEEVGHHKTTGAGTVFVVHFSYHVALEMTKTEEKAIRWATIEYLMPTRELAKAILDGRRTVDELADHFYVTRWMVHRRLHFLKRDLRREQGLRVKGIRDLFAPILVENLWGNDPSRPTRRLEVS